MDKTAVSCLLLLLITSVDGQFTYDQYGHACTVPKFSLQGPSQLPGGLNIAFLVHNTGNMSNNIHLITNSIVDYLHKYFHGKLRNCAIGLCVFNSYAQCPYQLNRKHCSHSSTLDFNITSKDTVGSNIADGLQWSLLFENRYPKFPNLCILITTEPPDNSTLATAAAKRLKEEGSNVVAIIVGDKVGLDDVTNLATNVKAVYTVSTGSDDAVNTSSVTDGVGEMLEQAMFLPRYRWCYSAVIQLSIIVDVTTEPLRLIKLIDNFIANFDTFDNFENNRVTIICSQDDFNLIKSELISRQSSYKKLDNKIILSATTFIRGMRNTIERPTEYIRHRLSMSHIVMVVVDSFHNNTQHIVAASREYQRQGVHIMALGVGEDVTDDDIAKVVTDPRGTLMTKTDDDLDYGLGKLFFSLCGEPCQEGWTHRDGMCYRYFPRDVSWDAARNECERKRAKLVCVTDREKYDWIKTEFLNNGNTSVFIGLRKNTLANTRVSSDMRWLNGKPLLFSDWSKTDTPSEPNGGSYESCVAWYSDGWRDVVCGGVLGSHYICERSAFDRTEEPNIAPIVRPLWEEDACKLGPVTDVWMNGPILITNTSCAPIFITHTGERELRDIFTCSNGEIVPNSVLCDGRQDCQDSSDEEGCPAGCTDNQFQCENGECLSMAAVCDMWSDCADNSDELNCDVGSCPQSWQWQCDNGQCIHKDQLCDLYVDCLDASDEAGGNGCSETCKNYACDDGTCIPDHWEMDGVVDCSGGSYEDELEDRVIAPVCFRGKYRHLPLLYHRSTYYKELPRCTMMFDQFGKHFMSWNMSKESCDEVNLTCPTGFYRCPASYCVPIERVCDGTMDCRQGEDEFDCKNYVCPGYFRCPGTSICHHPSRICDGEFDCPGGKDEVSCGIDCPGGCTCTAGLVECHNIVANQTSPVYKAARKVVIVDSHLLKPGILFKNRHHIMYISLISSGLKYTYGIFSDQVNLIKLNISRNELTTLSPISFSNQTMLKILDVSDNPVSSIEQFTGLRELEELYLKNTLVRHLQYGTFNSLVRLKVLDMRGHSLQAMADEAFIGLAHLSVMYMQGNPVRDFGRHTFEGLDRLESMYTDIFSLCCPQVRPKFLTDDKCISPESSISSCDDLLASGILRSSIWILCIAALLGNVVSSIMRLVWERASMKNGFGVFVTHLGIADFLMGVYLLFIAVADAVYTGTYIWHDYEWRTSAFCSIAGALSTLSSEASAFFIVLITLDRFLVIKYPFGRAQFRYKSASICAAVAWLLAVIIAVVPLFPSLSHWNFYTKNGACLALPFSTERSAQNSPGWIYSVVIFTGLNFTAFLAIALGQLSIYRAMRINSMVSTKKRRDQDMAVARRLLLIVSTDFLCWFPIGVMSILVLCGVSIGGEVFAWTAVFVLPVNSALNPFLYTIPAILKRRVSLLTCKGRGQTKYKLIRSKLHILILPLTYNAFFCLLLILSVPFLSGLYVTFGLSSYTCIEAKRQRSAGKTDATSFMTVTETRVKETDTENGPRVTFGDPSTEDVLLEDVLKKMASEVKVNLVKEIMAAIIGPLSTRTPDKPQPSDIYVRLEGQVPSKITLVPREDSDGTGVGFIASLLAATSITETTDNPSHKYMCDEKPDIDDDDGLEMVNY